MLFYAPPAVSSGGAAFFEDCSIKNTRIFFAVFQLIHSVKFANNSFWATLQIKQLFTKFIKIQKKPFQNLDKSRNYAYNN